MPSKKVQELAEKAKKLPPAGLAAVKMAIAQTPEQLQAATKEAEAILDAENPGWRTDNLVEKIRSFDGDIRSFESRIKTIRERMVEVLENTDEYDAVLELEEKLKAARADLKRRLEADSDYMHLTEEMADEKLSLRDAKQNMSDFLLGYFAETKERQIELGPQYTREVLLTGKLGKTKDFQTNIFSRPPIDENRKDLQ